MFERDDIIRLWFPILSNIFYNVLSQFHDMPLEELKRSNIPFQYKKEDLDVDIKWALKEG